MIRIMNLAIIERLRIEMRQLFQEATRDHTGRIEEEKYRVSEAAIALLEQMQQDQPYLVDSEEMPRGRR
jgi:hypothetical protein